MKKLYKIIVITAIIFAIFMPLTLKVPNLKAEPPKVIDLSNITLPLYKLPDNAKITKEELVRDLSKKLEMCREGKEFWDSRFPDSPLPTRIQVITISYGQFTKIFYDNKDASILIPKGKLYLLVVIDIAKPLREVIGDMSVPYEQMELWEKQGLLESDKPFIVQQYQLIDPETGIVVEWGYNKNIFILPKQD